MWPLRKKHFGARATGSEGGSATTETYLCCVSWNLSSLGLQRRPRLKWLGLPRDWRCGWKGHWTWVSRGTTRTAPLGAVGTAGPAGVSLKSLGRAPSRLRPFCTVPSRAHASPSSAADSRALAREPEPVHGRSFPSSSAEDLLETQGAEGRFVGLIIRRGGVETRFVGPG